MRLGILDPSPGVNSGRAVEAFRETLELSRAADELGYERFWCTEHHGSPAYLGCAPEILIAQIAALTRRIRVGSGAILLSHYVPFKIAETFCALNALSPGRIDLGIGSATGVMDRAVARAMGMGTNPPQEAEFERKLIELSDLLDGVIPEHLGGPVTFATGASTSALPMWIVGTGPRSAALAATLGCGYCFGHFFSGSYDGANLIRLYRERFRPSKAFAAPIAMVALFVVCASTKTRADDIASPYVWHLAAPGAGAPSTSFTGEAYACTQLIQSTTLSVRGSIRERLVIGDRHDVFEQLDRLRERYAPDEFLVQTVCAQFRDRMASYEMLASFR